jgi:hypothetical protein
VDVMIGQPAIQLPSMAGGRSALGARPIFVQTGLALAAGPAAEEPTLSIVHVPCTAFVARGAASAWPCAPTGWSARGYAARSQHAAQSTSLSRLVPSPFPSPVRLRTVQLRLLLTLPPATLLPAG